jgi:hypothetical protein
MSTDIGLTISAPTIHDLPSQAQVTALFVTDPVGRPDDFVDQTLSDTPPRWVLQWYGSKYGLTNSELDYHIFTQSRAFPLATYHVEEEWDDEGAGGEGFEIRNGQIVRRGAMKWVWDDV